MKISIITTSFNYESYIQETIESVIAQTYKDWELIIFDDGSIDNSVELINSYCTKDSRIKLYQHKNGTHKGLKRTLLEAVKKAKNEWIAFLESDDTITNNYLEKKINVLKKNPEINFIFNDVNRFGDEERIREYDKYFDCTSKILKTKEYPANLLKYFEERNLVPTFSCVMLKRKIIDKLDFNCPVKPLLDYYLWAQVAQNNKLYYIDEKLTNWRMHKKSYISKTQKSRNINQLLFKLKKKKYILNGKWSLFYKIWSKKEKIKYTRKKYIKIHLKERRIYFWGTWIEPK